MKKKETRGGTRINSGVKPKYSEPSKYIKILVPISKLEIFKAKVKELTDNWATKKAIE